MINIKIAVLLCLCFTFAFAGTETLSSSIEKLTNCLRSNNSAQIPIFLKWELKICAEALYKSIIGQMESECKDVVIPQPCTIDSGYEPEDSLKILRGCKEMTDKCNISVSETHLSVLGCVIDIICALLGQLLG
ncbi:uncharacterized protein LOC142230580 [Haematobia irritans]|uniref:uncharacterized protein LOC142230579 n=1 Tax=Haematobia irritans TaxID=7368 RepID=UPI003F4F7791